MTWTLPSAPNGCLVLLTDCRQKMDRQNSRQTLGKCTHTHLYHFLWTDHVDCRSYPTMEIMVRPEKYNLWIHLSLVGDITEISKQISRILLAKRYSVSCEASCVKRHSPFRTFMGYETKQTELTSLPRINTIPVCDPEGGTHAIGNQKSSLLSPEVVEALSPSSLPCLSRPSSGL